MLKVLHLFNVATVPQTLAKYQREFGLKVDVVTRSNRVGFDDVFPDLKILTKGLYRDVLTMIRIARKYDVLHVHSNLKIAKILKKMYRNKKVILTNHGSDVRDKEISKFPQVDLLTYATPDLKSHVSDCAIYVPNIVDEEHFSRLNDYCKGTVLHLNFGKGHEEAKKVAKNNAIKEDLKLTIIDISINWFSYNNIPRFLELFEYYDEVKINQSKNGGFLKFLSLTSLQALYLGGKVYFYGEKINSFPIKHDAYTVVRKWIELYEK